MCNSTVVGASRHLRKLPGCALLVSALMQIVHLHALPSHFRDRAVVRSSDTISSVVHSSVVSLPIAMCLVLAAVLLRPVANQLESADDLADREETNDLSSDDADGRPLCV